MDDIRSLSDWAEFKEELPHNREQIHDREVDNE